jgi:hypothetical protein
MVGGLAAAAAVRTWPFRVYSFPSEIKVFPSIDKYLKNAVESLNRDMNLDFYLNGNADPRPPFTFDRLSLITLEELKGIIRTDGIFWE